MTPLPLETLPQELLEWLTPFTDSGRVRRLPTALYFPVVFGPAREFVRRRLRTRQPAEMVAAIEPLAASTKLALRGEIH